jgi:hypothetical protein
MLFEKSLVPAANKTISDWRFVFVVDDLFVECIIKPKAVVAPIALYTVRLTHL